MDIFEKFNEFGKSWGKAKNLDDVFGLVLKNIDLAKGHLDMDSVFKIVGDELLKSNISSIISIINEQGDKIIFRHFSLHEALKNILPFQKSAEMRIDTLSCYRDAAQKNAPVFTKNRIASLGELLPESKKDLYKIIETNSLITPLVLRYELIGFIELFSMNLEKKDVDVITDFARRLMTRITNIILFNEIKESEKKQRDIYENAKEGFVFLNGRKRYFTDVNKAMTDFTGYSNQELKSMDYIRLFHPEERERIEKYVQARLEGNFSIGNAPMNYETRLLTKDKETKYVKITIVRIVSKDEWFSIIEDLTDRKLAEQALKKSEEKYRLLIDNAGDAIIIFNPDSKISFANFSFLSMTEYAKNDLGNLSLSHIFKKEDCEKIIDLVSGKLNGDMPESLDLQMITKNKNLKYVSFSGVPTIINNKIVSFQAILRDITETKTLAEKIHRSKKHYEQVIDTIQDGICVINKNYEIESCNRVFAEKINIPITKIKSLFCGSVMPNYEDGLFKNHCVVNGKKQCIAKKVFETGEALQIVEKNEDTNGQIKYHRFSLFPTKNDEGEIYQVVITINDITERKIAEDKIKKLSEFNQRILDNSPVSIIVLDRHGIVIMVNSFAKKMIKRSENEILSLNLLETRAIQRDAELLKKYKYLLKKGEPFYHDNLSYQPNKDSDRIYLNVIAVPLFDENGKVDGVISMAIDNTETIYAKQRLEDLNRNLEKKVNQRTVELDKANKELAKVLDLKSKFISDASHELRTPLTIIQGNLDLAIQEKRNRKEEFPEFYLLINKELERMTKILTDLTMLTNADANTERLEHDLINLDLLLTATNRSLEVLALQKNIKLKLDKKIPKNLFIWGDEARIEKLVTNVIRNAIKYTDYGGWVKVGLSAKDKYAIITVEDNGIGIPEEDLPYIFERFYRVDKARSRAEGGTGLGLAICKWIAEAHHGCIKVQSVFGKGSKFTISIPFDYKK